MWFVKCLLTSGYNLLITGRNPELLEIAAADLTSDGANNGDRKWYILYYIQEGITALVTRMERRGIMVSCRDELNSTAEFSDGRYMLVILIMVTIPRANNN